MHSGTPYQAVSDKLIMTDRRDAIDSAAPGTRFAFLIAC